MTPYTCKSTCILNPEIEVGKLHFGPVSSLYSDKVGTIIKTSYYNKRREMAYLVQYENEPIEMAIWFLESEIILVYSHK
jgi:hypothetical protein